MKTIRRYLILIIICVASSLAVTFATYFYSHSGMCGFFGMTICVYRGWPLHWATESHHYTQAPFPPAFYPFDFQALNFSLDLVFWTTVLLFPSSLYLYLRKHTKAERLITNSTKQF